MPEAPRLPRGTGVAGRALWRSVTGTFVLEEHELVILAHAVKVADRIDALDAEVDQDGVQVDTSQGPRAHPCLVESRAQRLVLSRLVASLRLPDTSDQRPQHRGGFRGPYGPRAVRNG